MRVNILRWVFTVERENQEKAMGKLMRRLAKKTNPGAILLVPPEERKSLDQMEKLGRSFWCHRRNGSR